MWQVWIQGASELTVNFDPGTFRVCHADVLTLASSWNLNTADEKVYTGLGTPTTAVTIPGDRLYIQYHSAVALTEDQPWSFTVAGCGLGLSSVSLSLLSTYVRLIGTAFPVAKPFDGAFVSRFGMTDYRDVSDGNTGSAVPKLDQLDRLDAMDRIDRSLDDAVCGSPRTKSILWQSEMLNMLWKTLTDFVTQLRGRY